MDNLFQMVSKINTVMNTYIKNELEKAGYPDLHVSHGKVLINFMQEDQLNYKELSDRINKSPQTMTTLIRKLEKEGFVELHRGPKDKRNKMVSITKKGKSFIPVMMDISKKLYEIQYSNIEDEDKAAIQFLLNKIKTNFEVNHER